MTGVGFATKVKPNRTKYDYFELISNMIVILSTQSHIISTLWLLFEEILNPWNLLDVIYIFLCCFSYSFVFLLLAVIIIIWCTYNIQESDEWLIFICILNVFLKKRIFLRSVLFTYAYILTVKML